MSMNGLLNDFARELLSDIILRSDPTWSIQSVEDGTSSEMEDCLRIAVSLSGSLQSKCFVILPLECARILAERAADGTADGLIAKISSAMRGFRSLHAAQYGQFQAEVGLITELTEDCSTHSNVTLSVSETESFVLCISGTATFMESLERATRSGSATAGQEMQETVRLEAISSEPTPFTLDVPNLEMVMDVELDVTLRFGQRHLTLREVMELTSGSVVELDRQVDEPVELLLDGKIIARGEAVVVDGNYGLRVTEVPHPVIARQARV